MKKKNTIVDYPTANFLSLDGNGGLQMMTAAQVKEKTKERITQVAKEFILNEIEPAIDEAISFGRFCCTVSINGIINPTVTGAEVVSQLQALGFEAEHIEDYIDIKWEAMK